MSISVVWRPIELALTSEQEWVEFEHESGLRLRRPTFWDGGDTWRVRFAAPEPGLWKMVRR